jgi:hypothetical protein
MRTAALTSCFIVILLQGRPAGAAVPISVDTKNLRVLVDAANCRWSVEVKGPPMRLNDVYFLPGDNPSGWPGAIRLTASSPGLKTASVMLTSKA